MKLYSHNKGYTEAVIDGKRTLLHRVIYEKHHSVELISKDIIHHIDGNIENNNISNLELMNRSEHAKLHMSSKIIKMKKLECMCCSIIYTIRLSEYNHKVKSGQKVFVCSKRCVGLLSSKYLPIPKSSEIYKKNVLSGLSEGLSGPEISKKYNMNRETVYNIIRKIKEVP